MILYLSQKNDGSLLVAHKTDQGETKLETITSTSPIYIRALEAYHSGNFDRLDYLVANPEQTEFFNKLSYEDGVFTYCGLEIPTKLLELAKSMSPAEQKSLLAFLNRLDSNTSYHTRNQLMRFLTEVGLTTVLEDGRFVAYKGCADEDGTPVSIHSGKAFVDGVKHVGHIPNKVGTVITMQRREVSDDPATPCHVGLHAGSLEYASNFGEVVLRVAVAPEDVVSVPYDCNSQKIRTCKYEVLDAEYKSKEAVYGSDNAMIELMEDAAEELSYLYDVEVVQNDKTVSFVLGDNSYTITLAQIEEDSAVFVVNVLNTESCHSSFDVITMQYPLEWESLFDLI